jgi:hypothetical protein
MKEVRHPQLAAIAAAMIGERKKLALPPIACTPSARPWFCDSTEEEIKGGAAGWYPPPRTPMSAKKKTSIKKLLEKFSRFMKLNLK